MSWQSRDRVRETSTTTGTAAYVLGGAKTGFQGFGAALADGDLCYYAATDGVDWEVGLSTYTATSSALSRSALASSNGNALVVWGTGTRDLFLDAPAAKLIQADDQDDVTLPGNLKMSAAKSLQFASQIAMRQGTSTLGTYNAVAGPDGTDAVFVSTRTTSGGMGVGIGAQSHVVPVGYNRLDVGPNSNIIADAAARVNSSFQHSNNAEVDAGVTKWQYINGGDYASSYGLNNGKIFFRVAGTNTGTALGAITWQEAMMIFRDGKIAMGATTAPSFAPAYQLDIHGDVNIRGGGTDAYRIAGSNVLSQTVISSNTYTLIRNPDELGCLYFGNSGDPTNYYEATTHQFYTYGGGTQYAYINAAGIHLAGTGQALYGGVSGVVPLLEYAGSVLSLKAGGSPATKIMLADGAAATHVASEHDFYDQSSDLCATIDVTGLKVGPQSTWVHILSSNGILAEPAASTNGGFSLLPTEAHGAVWTEGYAHELFTPGSGTSADTAGLLLPANSLIIGVVARVTTGFSGSGTLSIGDATTAARFASGVALTAGTTVTSLATMNSANTNAQGPVQTAAAKIRLTRSTGSFNGTGAIRLVVFYRTLTAPSS